MDEDNPLGAFLMDRRKRLDPVAFGFSGRRRTPGLRREEVAQRANISTTWYTWLEQGRGGAPSPRVLDSLAEALTLDAAERDHLFLVGSGRPPRPVRTALPAAPDAVSSRLQRFLDALTVIPATVTTPEWDVVAWNAAARIVLTDYASLAYDDRNVLRRMFLDPRMRAEQLDWDGIARFVVATFRAETARAGQSARATALIDELTQASPEFAAMWAEKDVRAMGEGSKRIRHATAGPIAFEFSTFAVDGQPDLKLVVYNPAGPEDAAILRKLCEGIAETL